MSSQKYATPLTLRPDVSRLLATFLIVGYGGGIALLFTVPVEWWLRLFIIVMAIASFAWNWRKHLGTDRIVEATWEEDGVWFVRTGKGELSARLHPETYVTPWLTVLLFDVEGARRRALVILPDTLHAEDFRRLRVRLQIEGKRSLDKQNES